MKSRAIVPCSDNGVTRGVHTLRRLISLLLALDILAITGLLRPLRFSSHYPGETLSIFDIIGHNASATTHYTVLTAVMVLLFVAAYRLAATLSGPQLTLVVFGGAGLLCVTYLLLYPATSSDLFHYVMEGRILWHYHENPFTVTPSVHDTDVFFANIIWISIPSPYGPAWAFLTAIPILMGHGDPISTLIAFKLLSVAFYFLGAVSIFHTVRYLRPGSEWAATVLWTWNPLVLMYVAGNGANDAIMMGLTLLAVFLAVRGRWYGAFPVLALATLVKFVSVVLVPVFILYALLVTPRAKWRSIVESLGVSSLIAVLLYAPFWRGSLTFATLRYQLRQFTDSPPAILHELLTKLTTPERAAVFTKTVALSAFAAVYALVLWRMYDRRRRVSPDDLPSACFLVMAAFLMLTVYWFQPWYLVWLVSLGALTVGVRLRLTLLFSLTGLLTHTATSIAAIQGWYYPDPLPEMVVTVATVFGPPAIYIGYVVFSRTRAGRSLLARIGRRTAPAALTGSRGGATVSGGPA